ncbi:MAG: NADH dehydrogenase (quinone) subunit D [Armatimonadetes bacterium]|nr:NADH dehydrogenase (quinone) subunit D [Armatimonadota bacterium]
MSDTATRSLGSGVTLERNESESLMTINMGPQHPSTHGVLRIILELDGETVVKAVPVIGYLHTGFEKTMEVKKYQQVVTLVDRMDYLAPLSNNLGYVLAVEKLMEVEIPTRGQWIRVMLTELQRISSHLVWLGTHAMDIGAMTVFLYCFREREQILDLFEMVSGFRMHTSYFRVGGLAGDLPHGFEQKVKAFIDPFPARVDEYEALLTHNEIWVDRTRGIGYLSPEDGIALGVSGPALRASGVKWDIRKAEPYSGYDLFDFEIPTREEGDVYARYLVRLAEMRQSTRIVQQALEGMPLGPFNSSDRKVVPPNKEEVQTSMEALIHHFKLWTEGFHAPRGEITQSIEAPKGELLYYLVSDGGPKPYRLRVRGPSFVNLQALPTLVQGRLIADIVAILGSLDPVLGEVDR